MCQRIDKDRLLRPSQAYFKAEAKWMNERRPEALGNALIEALGTGPKAEQKPPKGGKGV